MNIDFDYIQKKGLGFLRKIDWNFLKLNKLGFFWIVIGFFIVLLCLPPLIMYFFKPADIIMRLILAFTIFATVRGLIGGGLISLLVSALLIYIIVIKHAYAAASIYVFFYVFMGIGFLSVIIWGTSVFFRKH